ncbi:MAG: esterase/lipase family protein, partial [Gammaproteobacteria bacterium]
TAPLPAVCSHMSKSSLVFLFFLLTTLGACASIDTGPGVLSSNREGECVVLLHGLGRTQSSMRKIENELTSDGFTVANVAYRSRSASIEQLADTAISKGLSECRDKPSQKIHFVTHSLGGILLRYYLAGHAIDELGRSVMLAPPNQGSEAADVFRSWPGYSLLHGEAGFQLGTDENSVPLQLGAVQFDVGVIAGDRSIDPLSSLVLPNPDDGRVSVERTKVDGMNDFLVVHHSHFFIMKSKGVIRQIRHYLEFGEFDHTAEEPSS